MELIFKYFWLLAIAVNGLNAAIIWMRVQPQIQQQPEMRQGYLKLIRLFMVSLTIPWVIMGIGLMGGGVSDISDYFYPNTGNPYVLAWWISLWVLSLFFFYWTWFQGGADLLVQYPGFFRGHPKNPRTVKGASLLGLFLNAIVSSIFFSLNKP